MGKGDGSVKDVDLRRQDPEEMIFGAVTMQMILILHAEAASF